MTFRFFLQQLCKNFQGKFLILRSIESSHMTNRKCLSQLISLSYLSSYIFPEPICLQFSSIWKNPEFSSSIQPFSHLFPTGSRLPKIFRNRKEVGIRVPANPIIREICRMLDAPILTTTLPHDEEEDIEYVTDPELIDEKFGRQVDLIIDGGIGGYEGSTVVDCTGDEPEIVRQGKGELIL